MTIMTTTYVYNGVEVVATGRIATKKLKRDRTITLVEITPYDNPVEHWKRWVDQDDLMKISYTNQPPI